MVVSRQFVRPTAVRGMVKADDDAREGAAAAPGRPFESDKARSAESGRSFGREPTNQPNVTSMDVTLRGCHATEL